MSRTAYWHFRANFGRDAFSWISDRLDTWLAIGNNGQLIDAAPHLKHLELEGESFTCTFIKHCIHK